MIKKIMITTLLLSLIFGGSILTHLNDVAAASNLEEELAGLKYEDIIDTSNAYLESYDESNGYYGVYSHYSIHQQRLTNSTSCRFYLKNEYGLLSAHNPEGAGSNPVPATKLFKGICQTADPFFCQGQ